MSDRSETENTAADDRLIEHLRASGSDLTKSREVGVHFDAVSDDIANALAAQLRIEGWTVTVTRLESEWLVSGTEKWMLVTAEEIGRLRGEMERTALLNDAAFEGWQAGSVP
jgi:Regulator of ribonuclease activity B